MVRARVVTALAALALAVACGSTTDPEIGGPGSPDGGAPGPVTPGGDGDGGPGDGPLDGSADALAPNGPLRFIAVGDTGTGEPDQIRVANAMEAKCKVAGCDFVLLLGDNIYESGVDGVDDGQWQTKFEAPYAAIDLEFWAVLGNHDYGHNGLGTHFSKGQNEVDYTKKSKKWKMPAAHYHVTKGPVELFALDTNLQMHNRDDAQKVEVLQWLDESKSPWKIAVGHHPYLSNGPHGNAGSYDGLLGTAFRGDGVKEFMDEIVCGKVDLYLSGHDHNRQWLEGTCNGTELAVSGAGAKTSALEGTNPVRFQSDKLGFLYIVVDGTTLTAEFLDGDGKVEFTHQMKK